MNASLQRSCLDHCVHYTMTIPLKIESHVMIQWFLPRDNVVRFSEPLYRFFRQIAIYNPPRAAKGCTPRNPCPKGSYSGAMFSQISARHLRKSSNQNEKTPCFFDFQILACALFGSYCKMPVFYPNLQRESRKSLCLFPPNMAEMSPKSACRASHFGI